MARIPQQNYILLFFMARIPQQNYILPSPPREGSGVGLLGLLVLPLSCAAATASVMSWASV